MEASTEIEFCVETPNAKVVFKGSVAGWQALSHDHYHPAFSPLPAPQRELPRPRPQFDFRPEPLEAMAIEVTPQPAPLPVDRPVAPNPIVQAESLAQTEIQDMSAATAIAAPERSPTGKRSAVWLRLLTSPFFMLLLVAAVAYATVYAVRQTAPTAPEVLPSPSLSPSPAPKGKLAPVSEKPSQRQTIPQVPPPLSAL